MNEIRWSFRAANHQKTPAYTHFGARPPCALVRGRKGVSGIERFGGDGAGWVGDHSGLRTSAVDPEGPLHTAHERPFTDIKRTPKNAPRIDI